MIEIKQLKVRYDSTKHRDFRELVNSSAEKYGKSTAFIIKEHNKGDISYKYYNFIDFKEQVYALGTAMLNRGYKGKRIAVIGVNRYEWILSYIAINCGIGVCVPLDKLLPLEELHYSLAKSEADVLIYDKTVAHLIDDLKDFDDVNVQEYISMDEAPDKLCLRNLLEEGFMASDAEVEEFSNLPIDPHAMSILLFTSGTTSKAKAVMLSQDNITSNIHSTVQGLDLRDDDTAMAFLPYHHAFGIIGQVIMLSCGIVTTYCDGLRYVQKNICEYKVSVFFCVPLLIESMYSRILKTIESKGIQNKVNKALKVSNLLLKVGIDVRRKLFKEIHDQLGGNLRMVVSGAAAIDPATLDGLNGFGFNALQGYGMTETSPIIAVENTYQHSSGSIGLALPDVEAAIYDPDENGIGELIVKGPSVMLGYYKDEEATSNTIVDGWLHTGDLVHLNDEGYIFICGRKKNVIVLKNGKNVFPEELELLINNIPYVEECMVYGEPKKVNGGDNDLALCAKVVCPSDKDELLRLDIDRLNDNLPSYKRIYRLVTTETPMIKTTTGKVKRNEELNHKN
ncbi:MAG: AMP-binding protein [Bacillota bacterium]|nr:AMP-binding protein [Bacillota bacterium]